MKKFTTTVLSLAAMILLAGSAPAQQWGTIEGKVVWGGDKVPERKKIVVTTDKANCLRNGDILEENYVIDPKTKGIRNVIVFLAEVDAKGDVDPNAAPPINPALKALKNKKVVLDQPCCMFVPNVLGIQEGQILTLKNSDKVPHNTMIIGGDKNPSLNPILPSGAEKDVEGWKASMSTVAVSCSIHPWMKSWIRVFNHPYFVVTGDDGKFEIKDAPAGKYRLVFFHPEGYLEGGKNGIGIKITKGTTTTVPDIKVMPPEEKKSEEKK